MSQYLPLSNFKMIPLDKYEYVMQLPNDSEVGAFLKVDLEYPESLHDLHNDYPLAVERIKDTDGEMKLIPNLFNKKEYVCHYRLLQFYVEHGLKVAKVHEIMSFKQSPHLKSYILKNTELRKQAKTPFEKDFFKLLNNSCFGKTMENIRKRKDIRLVNNGKSAKKLIAQPNYKSFKIFNDSLAAFTMTKSKVKLDKPVFIGAAILDLSKLLMFEFYYDHYKVKYPESRVLYTDTDSLIIDTPTDDI